MSKVELIMPKMGESIMEATILKWVKGPGDMVEQDETILEIATDKVDSEIPAPVSGKIVEILFPQDSIVQIGKVIAIIETDANASDTSGAKAPTQEVEVPVPASSHVESSVKTAVQEHNATTSHTQTNGHGKSDKFYSPLVKNIAKQENISVNELDGILGTGAEGRVTKKDILDYVSNRGNATARASVPTTQASLSSSSSSSSTPMATTSNGQSEIIEMDRMRRLIADHMVMSKHTSPHVTSFVEADVTNIVKWRENNKNNFAKVYNEKITFTPIFIEAVVKAVKDFPMINISVNGSNIIVKKNINIGMAAALPSGNLIVPVIKNADYLNLAGLTKSVNDLADRARTNKLKPEEIQDGTFTITNVGTFGNVMGTPIINQPQVAILAVGAIRKKPAVIETEYGDVIAIRHMMFLSLSYDHRVVDGFLGGSFLRRIADYMEGFDINRNI